MDITTKEDISEWFDSGLDEGQKYMIVVCDTFSYEDFPVYCTDDTDYSEKYIYHKNYTMQRIMEVYNLLEDKEDQLNMTRCFNGPPSAVPNFSEDNTDVI